MKNRSLNFKIGRDQISNKKNNQCLLCKLKQFRDLILLDKLIVRQDYLQVLISVILVMIRSTNSELKNVA